MQSIAPNVKGLSRARIIAAFAIAILADAIQFPVAAATASGMLAAPGEFTDFVLDCIVMAATSVLIGFHWMLLPSMFIEVIPGLDLLPTWTGCVALVVRQRRKQQGDPPPLTQR
jgi:hypothetical protein